MRQKMVESGVVECVIGVGPNLFYNSTMEACILICRMNKPKALRNKVLFINAVDDVAREKTQSFLTNEHIERIVEAYRGAKDIPAYATVATLDEICKNDFNLSIPMYVESNGSGTPAGTSATSGNAGLSLCGAIAAWQSSSATLRESMDGLFATLDGGQH